MLGSCGGLASHPEGICVSSSRFTLWKPELSAGLDEPYASFNRVDNWTQDVTSLFYNSFTESIPDVIKENLRESEPG